MKRLIITLGVFCSFSLDAMLSRPITPALTALQHARSESTLRQKLLPIVASKETHDRLIALSNRYYKYAAQGKTLPNVSLYAAFTPDQLVSIGAIFILGFKELGDRWLEANGFHGCQQELIFPRVEKAFAQDFVQEKIFEKDSPFGIGAELIATASPRYAFDIRVILMKCAADVGLQKRLNVLETMPHKSSLASIEQRLLIETVVEIHHFDVRLLAVADLMENVTSADMKIKEDFMHFCADPVYFPSGM